jgi:glycosyltransferase involved in cell wall biosynthesis
MEDINYSIIIPHKNTPDLLWRCLSSIPKRKDIEIIIVDDSSDPKIVNFDNFPGSNRDDAHIYFTKENKGAGFARNVGIKNANGQWLLFADADDFFLEGFLSVLDNYKESDADIVFFKSLSVYSDNLKPADRHFEIDSLIENYLSNKKNSENKLRYMFYYPYSKMIRRELILRYNILFDEIKVSNDVWFAVQIGYYAKKILAERRPIYCITVRNHSLSKTTGEDIFDIRVATNLKVDKFMKKIKVKHSHYPMLTYVLQSRKYGIKKVIDTALLSIKNGSCILEGFGDWLVLKINSIKDSKRRIKKSLS